MQHYYLLSSENSLRANRQTRGEAGTRIGGGGARRRAPETSAIVARLYPISEQHQLDEFSSLPEISSSRQGTQPRALAQSPSDGNQRRRTKKMSSASTSNSNNNSGGNAQRPYDIIIFAASSSIGQFVVEELALVLSKQQQVSSKPGSNEASPLAGRRQSVPSSKQASVAIRWAVAGRSPVRLNETLCRAQLSTGTCELARRVPIVLADLNAHDSLLSMCKQTRLVLNCAGPYAALGAELLINAAIDSGTHYLDLSHESVFNELMRRAYTERAKRARVFVVQGCGFQSMSSELGLNFIKRVVDDQIEHVEILLNLSCSSSGGLVLPSMWNSLLADKALEESPLNIADGGVPEQAAHTKRRLQRKDTQSLVKESVQFRNRYSLAHLWWLPVRFAQAVLLRLSALIAPSSSQSIAVQENFLSATVSSMRGYICPIDSLTSDESELIRNEMGNYELRGTDLDARTNGWRPIRCSNFISLNSFSHLCLLTVWMFFFQFLAQYSLARRLMRAFPRLATLRLVGDGASIVLPSTRSLAVFKRPATASFISRQRSDRSSLSHIKFSQTFFAYGTPSDESSDERQSKRSKRKRAQLLVSRIVGPEPNRVASATFAVQAALTLVLEREHLPRSGGVHTPGALFAETNIIHQLRKRHIKFEILKKAQTGSC